MINKLMSFVCAQKDAPLYIVGANDTTYRILLCRMFFCLRHLGFGIRCTHLQDDRNNLLSYQASNQDFAS